MRRPLIVISPKSLLRNPQAVSSINDLTEGSFEYVIDDLNTNPAIGRENYYVFGKGLLRLGI